MNIENENDMNISCLGWILDFSHVFCRGAIEVHSNTSLEISDSYMERVCYMSLLNYHKNRWIKPSVQALWNAWCLKKSRKRDKHHKPCGKNWMVGAFHTYQLVQYTFYPSRHMVLKWCSNFWSFKWMISTSGSFWGYTKGTTPNFIFQPSIFRCLLPFFSWGGGSNMRVIFFFAAALRSTTWMGHLPSCHWLPYPLNHGSLSKHGWWVCDCGGLSGIANSSKKTSAMCRG